MAVFRVEKTRDYTIMSNHHLKNKQMTLKAKGLMCVMLSLPDDWDYTLSGLQKISREGQDAIRQALHELEKCGYLVRNRIRDEKGHLTDMEYVIYEQPHLPEAAAERLYRRNLRRKNLRWKIQHWLILYRKALYRETLHRIALRRRIQCN